MDLKKLLKAKVTALIVIDKQAGYFDPNLVAQRNRELPENASQILKTIDSLILKARKLNVEVIWTQMVEDIEDSPPLAAEMLRNDPDGTTTVTKPGTPSFDIYGKVQPLVSEKVIKKFYMNAFARTDLANYLKKMGKKSVVLIGGYGPRCVLSTAVGANGEDLYVVVVDGAISYQTNTANELGGLYGYVGTAAGSKLSSRKLVQYWKN